MKFYEFKDNSYYALITANCEEDAIGCFHNYIFEPDEDEEDVKPIEITEGEARKKYVGTYDPVMGMKSTDEDFDDFVNNPDIYLLMDGCVKKED